MGLLPSVSSPHLLAMQSPQVNHPLILDAVEKSVYMNSMVVMVRLFGDLIENTTISGLGHKVKFKLEQESAGRARRGDL